MFDRGGLPRELGGVAAVGKRGGVRREDSSSLSYAYTLYLKKKTQVLRDEAFSFPRWAKIGTGVKEGICSDIRGGTHLSLNLVVRCAFAGNLRVKTKKTKAGLASERQGLSAFPQKRKKTKTKPSSRNNTRSVFFKTERPRRTHLVALHAVSSGSAPDGTP